MFDSRSDETAFEQTVKNIETDNERVRRKFATAAARNGLLDELLKENPALKDRLERKIQAKLASTEKKGA
jgi:hypothetical protein